jgi:hypothetical protein
MLTLTLINKQINLIGMVNHSETGGCLKVNGSG